MAINPCDVTSALANFQFDLILRMNRKFEALRRLALLLSQLGDLSSLFPNLMALLPNLLPINLIDMSVYINLARSCPMLGLPDVGDGPISDLRSKVAAAYGNLTRDLLNHPYMRMDLLQSQMDKYISRASREANNGMGTALDYLTCLNAMCEAGASIGSTLSSMSKANIGEEITKFAYNFQDQAGQVLTEPLRIKRDQGIVMLGQLKELGSDVKYDYQTAKSITPATFSLQSIPSETSVPVGTFAVERVESVTKMPYIPPRVI